MKSAKKGHRRVLSYFSYALSSIIFDIVAYSTSGKIYPFILAHQQVLFFFPSLAYNFAAQYMTTNGYKVYALNAMSILLIALPVLTFLSGILVHRAVVRKQIDSYSTLENLE